MNKEYFTYRSKNAADPHKPLVLAIVGKSATGKDSLAKWLEITLQDHGIDAHRVISDTTRPPREGEKDGEDYYFLSPQEFERHINDGHYLEYTIFRDWYYGTNIKSLFHEVSILVINPAGLHSLAKYQDKYNIVPIYLELPAYERLVRSIRRERKIRAEYFRRLVADYSDFKTIRDLLLLFDYKIIIPEHVDGVYYKTKHILNYLDRFGLCGLGNSR